MSYAKPSVKMFRYKVEIAGPGSIIRVTLESKTRKEAETFAVLLIVKLFVDRRPNMLLTDKITGATWVYTETKRPNRRSVITNFRWTRV